MKRLCKLPLFREGYIFREGYSVNDGIRSEIIRLTDLIASSEGINTLDLATRRGKSKPTVERYLKLAKLLGVIEFSGAPKTGGYYLTKKMKKKLKE